MCRRYFYKHRDWSHLDTRDPEGLPKDRWTSSHSELAILDGYNECQGQIDELLTMYSRGQLRAKIGYSKLWHGIPLAIVVFLGLVCIAMLRPIKKATG